MKTANLFGLLSRVVAVPLAWCIAIGGSSAAVPEQNQTRTLQPRSDIPPDRMKALHSLLGEKVVPSDLLGIQTVIPLPPSPLVAGEVPSPPPPPVGSPPPPPP
jgi:hypothetical protein